MRVAAWLVVVLGCAASVAHANARPAWASDAQVATVAVHEASGDDAQMVVMTFLPPGPGPFPVVVFSHGRDPSEQGRARLAVGVSRVQAFFWRARGIAVVAPVRPGYGDSTGGDVEGAGVHFDSAGHCVGRADFGNTAEAAVRSVDATLQWLQGQPWADASQVLLVGQSAGGFATVAAGARALPGVVGYVNFAGGTGGNPARSRAASCDPGQVEALYAGYGKSTTMPNLWVYALNDQYWGPVVPREWHAAFARGGSATTFVQAPAVPDGDGHGLSRHPPSLWAPTVDAFLERLGPPWNVATLPRPVLRLDIGGP